jgi:DNA gyrase subunit B
MTKKTYNASDIDTLEILDAIQLRSGMYIGSVDDDGVEVCVREVVDNAVDEHMNGNGNRIVVSVDPETGLIGVEDAARGIPVENHPKHPGLSTLEVVLTKAHSGGKFGSSYGVAGGLHGTGLKAVTALSSHLKATVWRDAKEHTLVFNDAKVVQKLDTKKAAKGHETKTGTMIEFRLDPKRFPDATSTVPSRERLQRMLRERAYLNPGLKLYLRWKGEKEELFHEKEGIDAYVSAIAGEKKIFAKAAHFENDAGSDIRVAVAVAWTSGYGRDSVQGFCNCVRQPEGGTHVQGLRMALPGIVRAYIEANSLLSAKDKDLKVEGPDCFEGVVAIVSIKHKSPVFKGQAKGSLSNSDAQGAVQKAVNAGLAQWLEENPKEAKALSARAIAAAKARIAASKAREQVRKQDAGTFGMKNFGKLKDCSSKDPVKNELFIVEGESAGGSGAMGRDRNTQAIYALKGKPLAISGRME